MGCCSDGRGRRAGFTLIELLVVIAIVAILAAIIFPVFLSAKAKAYETQCLSNLRQIGISTSNYASDNAGRLPPWMAKSSDWPQGTWFVCLQAYSRTRMLAKCPADGLSPSAQAVSYWKNAYTDLWSGAAGQLPNARPVLETSITYPKTICYLMDGPNAGEGNHTWWGPPRTWGGDSRYSDYAKAAKDAETRHSGAANVLFCDWHVRRVYPNEWASTRSKTGAKNPLKLMGVAVSPPWNEKADGAHPWFRCD